LVLRRDSLPRFEAGIKELINFGPKNHLTLRLVTIVVPCFNEEGVVTQTYNALAETLYPLPYNWEIIFIDDGSKDKTVEELEKIHAQDERTKIIAFSRNFGHQIAVSAGIEASQGDAVVIIDADLQDPPSVIKEILVKWEEGFDVVYCVRRTRQGETFHKKFLTKVFYRFINKLSEIPLPLDTGDFRIMDRKVIDVLLKMPERDRYVRGMVAWIGFNQIPYYYDRPERIAGVSKYPLWKLIKLALDGIISFSKEPLKISAYIGLFAAMLSFIGIFYALYLRLFTSNWVTGWTLMFIMILFFGGVQLICIGIIGEYIGRVYGEVKHRPLYVVKKAIGFKAN